MLNIPGLQSRYCDGLTRRNFLKIGTFGFGATTLSMADVFRAEAAAGRSSHKSVINVLLGGGPPHQDMWDIKTEAPVEIRGEFQPIATNVAGIQIGECFPRLAGMMDKLIPIRTVTGSAGDRHDLIQCHTGFLQTSLATLGGRPSIGAAISKLRGPIDPSVPPFVGLAAPTTFVSWGDAGQTGFLGSAHAPFRHAGPGMSDLVLS